MKNKKLFAILTLVCFMMTLMPVAAFAADTALSDRSLFNMTSDDDVIDVYASGAMKVDENAATFTFVARDNGDNVATASGILYVWAKDSNGNVTSALEAKASLGAVADDTAVPQYAKAFMLNDTNKADITVAFKRAGEYTVYAGYVAGNGVNKVSDITPCIGSGLDTITVLGETKNPDDYKITVTGAGAAVSTDEDYDYIISGVEPNNVSEKYTLTFVDKVDKALTGKTVTIETDSDNITIDKETATTNYMGQIKVNLSASREGDYTLYVTIDGAEFVILVKCTNTSAAYIETVDEPENLIAQFTSSFDDVTFMITDINGNAVKNAGGDKYEENGNTKYTNNGATGIYGDGKNKAKYLYFVEKPAASSLKDSDLSLNRTSDNGKYTLNVAGTLDAEGKYVVKAILDNGAFATASWEVKRFQTPVELRIKAASTVELGKSLTPELEYVDVNKVVKDATDAKLAATGYAIYSFNGKTVTLKTDEKYAGQSITLTAVSERYDLVATKEVKIAAEATDIKFTEKSLAVNVNNKVIWNVVDSEGNIVRLNDVDNFKIRYVVLDKPENAKVSVYDLTDRPFNGEGEMALTSNTVGNVTVQVVAQVQIASDKEIDDNKKVTVNNENALGALQTKYYTGTQIFAVGTEGVGDVVVMSIGSNEIIINDKKATIDAEPIVQNDRTYVPFRALAEAFGATVAYDEATQAVTAELNGVTVVMTIGSATYTVNGAEKTMDVAPFINGSRTMVPVRFAAEAFGIKVIPTYNPDGTTADILFNL